MAVGTREQRRVVADAIIQTCASNLLGRHGEFSGYQDEFDALPYDVARGVLSDLLRRLPGDSWNTDLDSAEESGQR